MKKAESRDKTIKQAELLNETINNLESVADEISPLRRCRR